MKIFICPLHTFFLLILLNGASAYSQETIPAKEAPASESIEMEEAIHVEKVAPVLPTPPNDLELVASDLRKAFPKEDHIRIAERMGIKIDEIYY